MIKGVLRRVLILCLCFLIMPACKSLVEQQQNHNQQLFQSIKKADYEAIELLLKEGASPNASRYGNETALGFLIQQYKSSNEAQQASIERAIFSLLKNGAAPNNLHHGFTPLQIAAGQGAESIISQLIAFGADPDLETQAGLAPIWQAAYDNNYRIGLTLLKAGANPNAKNDQGQTPLEYLKSKGYSRTRLMLHLRYYGGH